MSKQARKVAANGTIHVKLENRLMSTNNLHPCDTVLINELNVYSWKTFKRLWKEILCEYIYMFCERYIQI